MAGGIPANDGSQGVSDASRDGEILYNYHQLHMSLDKDVDAVFCLCSLDPRVAVRAAQLFLDGYGRYLIFAGGVGRLTKGRYDKPEAEVFADIALEMGVSKEKLLVEPLSTNTGENIRFTYALLQERGLQLQSFLLVQKPYMERRTYATFKKQWPDPNTKITVTSPQFKWNEYPNESNPENLVINIAVGDLIRIREYPLKGFQIPQDIPGNVWEAAQRLIRAGYNSHLP
ncbi:DUF218 domain-containing protein [Annulohypoxylon maeteangense]|uniref:DUF218 domain-containing protein n=1 Tax=Annulohypoxylon maeteangense TaxID=1927788 RepID=UPI00200848C5|nr:DUF218 domain-containing protein [Annulohypoxylon maeteangense]KAI0882014.1 DUF218 domain-containing protein [Annulohypoxylon maeteangense]